MNTRTGLQRFDIFQIRNSSLHRAYVDVGSPHALVLFFLYTGAQCIYYGLSRGSALPYRSGRDEGVLHCPDFKGNFEHVYCCRYCIFFLRLRKTNLARFSNIRLLTINTFFVALMQVVEATKLSNGFPVDDDFQYYSTFSSFREKMENSSKKLLGMELL